MAQMVKPPPRFTHEEWTYSNNLKYRTAERERQAAERLENESDRLSDETEKRTEKTKNDVNKKIEQRLNDIKYWNEELDNKLKDLKDENERLNDYHNRLGKALEAINDPLHISQQCLLNREGRVKIDLVHDDVQKELMKEVEVNQGVQALLQKALEQSKEQIRLNRKAIYQLEQDMKKKAVAKNIDEYCAELKTNSHNIGFADGVAEIDPNSVTPEQWQDFSDNNIVNAEKQRQNSQNMRSIVDGLLQQTANDLRQQCEAVNLAFTRRITETKDTKGKLEEHLKHVLQEISNMEDNIKFLEKSIDDKMNPLKLAETRLQVRKDRPDVEQCRDPVQYRLIEEVGEINADIQHLSCRLADAKESLKGLIRRQLDLEEDIQIKSNTLFIDEVQCMGMRESISLPTF